MKLKAIVELDIQIIDLVNWLDLNEKSTHIDIVNAVESHIEELESTGVYTIPEESAYDLVQEIKKFLKYNQKHLTNKN